MAQQNNDLNGVDTSKDDVYSDLKKDLTPKSVKFKNYLKSNGAWVFLVAFLIIFMFVPQLNPIIEIAFIVCFIIYYSNVSSVEKLPFKKRKSSFDKYDLNELHPATNKPMAPDGITFFGNERNTKKEIWFTNSDVRTHCLIFGTTGAGKALKMDEEIHTPNGWVKNKNIKVGDKVSTPFGKSSVVGVYPQGKMDLYSVKFVDGREIEVSGDHLWEIHYENWKKIDLKDGTQSRAKVLTTKDLLVELNKDNKNKNYYVVLSGEVEKPKRELKISPYLLGALLGDGNMTSRNLRFSSIDEEIIEKISNELPEGSQLFKYKSNKACDYNIIFDRIYAKINPYSGRNKSGGYNQKELFRSLVEYKLLGSNSLNKFVPDDYKESCLSDRYALIQGLMDTDGYAKEGRVEFYSSSERLAKDLSELIRSVGGVAKIKEKSASYTYKEEKKKGIKHYRVYISHKEPSKLFSLKRKKDQVLTYQYSNTLKLKIDSVTKTNKKEECQCIKIDNPRGLFITKDYVVTHNTETMLSICVNSLNQHSGFIYVDGKGDNELWAKIFSLVASKGRLDDLYIVNFMTSHMNSYDKTAEKSSHTLNPCAKANASTLSELFVSLLPESSGDGMWQGRASIYISSLLKPLVYLRDKGKLLLDVDIIRKYFQFSKTEELSQRQDIPVKFRDGLIQYVENLPGYVKPTPDSPHVDQPESVAEQHGFITMQFTETFGLLSDGYGHIMKTQVAEVDFYDIVINRRILVVLLPALEKSKQSLGNLGKIIVASIKNMMSTTLGSKVEGDRESTIDMKPTKADSPFMTIFDEYGYYSVKGAAVMPAQARSLGFFMIFAGQDYQAFKAGSEDDVGSIIANCAIKICMKLEDPKETFEIFQKAAGQGKVAEIQSYEKDTKASSEKYQTSKNVSISNQDVINVSDLRNQNAGESHMLFKRDTRRLKHFYAEPKLLDEVRLNGFFEVEPLDYNLAKNYYEGERSVFKKYMEVLENHEAYKNQIRRSLAAIPSAKDEVEVVFKFLKLTESVEDEQLRTSFCLAAYIEKVDVVEDKIVTEIRDNIKKLRDYNEDNDIDDESEDIDMDDDLDFLSGYEDDDGDAEEEEDFDDLINKRKEEKSTPKPSNKVENGSDFSNRLEESIKNKKAIVDKEDNFVSGLFEALDLDYVDIKEKLSDMEYNVNNKFYLTGIENNKEKARKDNSENLVEDKLLDLTMEAKPKKQKSPKSEDIDSIISELLSGELEDL